MSRTAPRSSITGMAVRPVILVALAGILVIGVPQGLEATGLRAWLKQAHAWPYAFYESFVAIALVLIVLTVMAIRRTGLHGAAAELGIVPFAVRGFLLCVGAVAAALIVLVAFGAHRVPPDVAALAALGVVAPFAEEVLFRGFLFRQMRRWAGLPFWIAALLSSILFGLAHFSQGSSLADSAMNSTITFAGGVLFCWLTARWNSIWPGFAIHAGLNLLWSFYALGDNAVGGETGNIARIATIVVCIATTRALAPRPAPV